MQPEADQRRIRHGDFFMRVVFERTDAREHFRLQARIGRVDFGAHGDAPCRRIKCGADVDDVASEVLAVDRVDVDADVLPVVHLAHVLLGQLEGNPEFVRIGDEEQRIRRVRAHFLARIDRAVDDDAGNRRAQRIACAVACGIEIAQHALRAIEFRLGLAEVGLRAFEILARKHAEFGQLARPEAERDAARDDHHHQATRYTRWSSEE